MAKGLRRWIIFICTTTIVLVTISIYHQPTLHLAKTHIQSLTQPTHPNRGVVAEQLQDFLEQPFTIPHLHPTLDISQTHHEIFSLTSPSGKYIPLDFSPHAGTNPSIIPHPHLPDTFLMVAQQQKSTVTNTIWFAQLVCPATFRDGALRCTEAPVTLPIAATASPHCSGAYEHFAWSVGPHDARVFMGLGKPFVVYGSQSRWSCFGLWVQDLRMLVDWGRVEEEERVFRMPTDLRRPGEGGVVEKNWFFFWDLRGQMYGHYDVFPRRVFARVQGDGTAGEDLAVGTVEKDEKCLRRWLPELPETGESVHQATNSLRVTLCGREEESCVPGAGNTFVVTIVQHKKHYELHSVYEPYVVLFRAEAPFGLHAVSRKPLWIHGRGVAGEKRPKGVEESREWIQTEMLYVTSVSWKDRAEYHGYRDDVVLLGFGVEDETAGVVDIRMGDLLEGMELC